jgi:hypothetical protein
MHRTHRTAAQKLKAVRNAVERAYALRGKISPRGHKLLTLIGDATTWEGDERPGRVLASYFVPSAKPMYSPTLGEFIDVSTGGDASALRSLERAGLIVRMKPNASGGTERYYYRISEDGIAALA